MFIEKYPYIDSELAHQLIKCVQNRVFDKRGIDRKVFLLNDYVVLTTERLMLRNVDTRDDQLILLDEIIETLRELKDCGVGVIPILGYCCDTSSVDGNGYMIQPRAKGQEVYDDAIMSRYQVWAQGKLDDIYLKSDLNDDKAAEYILNRTKEISEAPLSHYERFVKDMLIILEKDILLDFNGQSNFFYDSDVGFQFIDIDSHNEFRYGLTKDKIHPEKIAARGGFVLCHRKDGLDALDKNAILSIGAENRKRIRKNNAIIAEKCCIAMRNNGISDKYIFCEMDKLYL